MRARDLGLACGSLPPGKRNSIADVPGVAVGHATLIEADVRTGVTAVLPHDGDLFRDKPVAAAVVLNGFGKSVGLMQLNELGTLETPILLTNTFAVGVCATALIRRAIAADPEIGRQTSTVNPVVLECNDGYLNDIQAMAVTEAHADAAIAAAGEDFPTGAVGAGTGMSCFGLKGGIGSASRRVRWTGRRITWACWCWRISAAPGIYACRMGGGWIRRRGRCPTLVPASSSSEPISRLAIAKWAGWRAAPAWGWPGAVRSGAMAVATSPWHSP